MWHKIKTWQILAFYVVCFFGFISCVEFLEKEKDKKYAIERALWVKASCPVIQTECGSKQKYACEVKSPAVGRVEYRGVFVTAFSTC